MLVIIDYGLGNLASVANALEKLNIAYQISDQPEVIQQASGIILPGVGAAGEGMRNLQARKLDKVILDQVGVKKPLLGICLGMQLLLSSSEEGVVDCLDAVKGQVKRFKTKLKVPQVGWNQVKADSRSQLMTGITDQSYFYFVHSYYCDLADQQSVTGVTNYDQDFCSVLETGSVFGVQFHPEKSGEVGLQLLQNFGRLTC